MNKKIHLYAFKHQAELEGRHSQARAWEREIETQRIPENVGLAIANPTKPAYHLLGWVAKKRQPNLHRYISKISIKDTFLTLD